MEEIEGWLCQSPGYLLHVDFVYRADRLIPCGVIIYTVTSTSPWRGLSALELLIRSQLWLRVYSTIESPKYFKAKLTRYCSYYRLDCRLRT